MLSSQASDLGAMLRAATADRRRCGEAPQFRKQPHQSLAHHVGVRASKWPQVWRMLPALNDAVGPSRRALHHHSLVPQTISIPSVQIYAHRV